MTFRKSVDFDSLLYIEQRSTLVGDCWIWTGQYGADGYGRFRRHARDKWRRAHRAAYEIVHGPVPSGLICLHTCDRPGCCNPAHIRVGTPAQNTADMMAKGRHRHGRPPSNVYPLGFIDRVRDLRRFGFSQLATAMQVGVSKSYVERLEARGYASLAH